MRPEEIRFLLAAARPRGEDDADPALREALEAARSDEDLRRWLDAERKMDAAFAAKLAEVPVPPGLRDSILAGARAGGGGWRGRRMVVLAVAAVLALLAVPAALFIRTDRQILDWRSDALAVFDNPAFKLDKQSSDFSQLERFLVARSAPVPAGIPLREGVASPVGCAAFFWRGHPVSLVCFKGAGDDLVHFFTIGRGALAGGRLPGHPADARVIERGGWHTRMWQDDANAYLMATRLSADQLRGMIAASGPGDPGGWLCVSALARAEGTE